LILHLEPLDPLETLSLNFLKNDFDQPESVEPVEPKEFEVLFKIDLYIDFYTDITSETSKTSMFSNF